MTKVSDKLKLNVPLRIFDEVLYVTICPDYKDKYLAIQLQFHGFKRAAIVNPTTHERLGTYDSVIEFANRWLFNEFGYERCQITTA